MADVRARPASEADYELRHDLPAADNRDIERGWTTTDETADHRPQSVPDRSACCEVVAIVQLDRGPSRPSSTCATRTWTTTCPASRSRSPSNRGAATQRSPSICAIPERRRSSTRFPSTSRTAAFVELPESMTNERRIFVASRHEGPPHRRRAAASELRAASTSPRDGRTALRGLRCRAELCRQLRLRDGQRAGEFEYRLRRRGAQPFRAPCDLPVRERHEQEHRLASVRMPQWLVQALREKEADYAAALDNRALTIDGVTVFRDHADPQQFWYLPGPVALARRPADGRIRFLLPEVQAGARQHEPWRWVPDLRGDPEAGPETERRILARLASVSGGPRGSPRSRSMTARSSASPSISRAAAERGSRRATHPVPFGRSRPSWVRSSPPCRPTTRPHSAWNYPLKGPPCWNRPSRSAPRRSV